MRRGNWHKKVEWVQNAIKFLKPESQGNVPDDALSELKKQIEELKLKQQTEMARCCLNSRQKQCTRQKMTQIN